MLSSTTVRGFKSLEDVQISLPKFSVFFGPNASGKSNFLDALQALSRLGSSRTISEALNQPIRGYPIESFFLPPGGLPALLTQESAEFTLDADISEGSSAFRYSVSIEIKPASGTLSVSNEYLATLGSSGEVRGRPSIEKVDDVLRIRRKSKPAHPREEAVGLGHTQVSDTRFSGVEYRAIERVRTELSGWRIYYLDPRTAMRSPRPPQDVRDIGVLGEALAPFLYRLREEHPKHFKAVERTIRSIVPSIEAISVDIDPRRGTLDVQVRQGGREFSSRVVSEGTLRVLALAAIAVNPWSGPLIAFEEPENGVHPRRLELIAQLLYSLAADQNRQVIVTTHSPIFCDAVLRLAGSDPDCAALFNVRGSSGVTKIERFRSLPLFGTPGIETGLTSSSEDGSFESAILRGLIDE